MQACIDECGAHGTAPPAQHAEQVVAPPVPQVLAPPMSQDSQSDGAVSRDNFDEDGASKVGGQPGISPGDVSASPVTTTDEEDDDDFTSLPLPDFSYWDTDKDGVLSVNEAYRLYHFGLEQHDLLSTESPVDIVSSFEDFFLAMDENGDGVVSHEEFDDEDDEGASVSVDKAVHFARTVHAAKTARPSKIAQPDKAVKHAKQIHSVRAAQSPILRQGFLSRRSEHGRHVRGSNSIREMARMMTALNREVRGL